MKTSILVWSALVVFSTAFNLDAQDVVQPPPITLGDGSKITFLGVTFGRHHVAPHYKEIGGSIATGNWIDRPNDITVAWIEIEHTPGQWPSYSLLVSDTGNTGCITAETSTRCHVRDGVDVHGFQLKAYPRWDKQFILRIASPYGQPLSNDKLLVTNPEWKEPGNPTVEALPQIKSDGDVTVTLTNLVIGAPLPPYAQSKDSPSGDPRSQCVRIGFDFKQNGHAATNWHPWVVILSDAVSNRLDTTMQFQDNEFMRGHWRGTPFVVTEADQYKGYFFHPGLWPNEPARNVRIEFTRDTGFDDDEILKLNQSPGAPRHTGGAGCAVDVGTRNNQFDHGRIHRKPSEIKIIPALVGAGSMEYQ